MQALKVFNRQELTMTSQEIAALVDSRHDDVKRSIERLAERGTIELPPMAVIKTATKPVQVYEIRKRDTYIIVAQLSPEFTAQLVDRWQELENKPDYYIPPTYATALQLCADQAVQLEMQAPKIKVYEMLADRKGDVSTTVLAKQIGITAFKLNAFLREQGVKWQNADLPKAGYETWLNVISDVKNNHEFTQCLVTPLGQLEITKLWNESLQK